jgi:DNA transposition AAA+ family ATPase
MKKEFVRTENDKRFRAALAKHAQAAAAESNLVVVHGRAGDGKTRTLHNWASSCNAVILTAHPGWTVRRMLVDLADRLSIPAKGDWEAAVEAQVAAEEIPVVVDEAGFALRDNAACLERLRSITDKSGTLLVAVVMERDMERLRQFDQLTSRATLCPFRASTLADVRAACAQLSAVAFAPDLSERIHRDSGARMRLVVEAINVAEQVGLAAGKTSISAADVSALSLCEDFNNALRSRRAQQQRGAAA